MLEYGCKGTTILSDQHFYLVQLSFPFSPIPKASYMPIGKMTFKIGQDGGLRGNIGIPFKPFYGEAPHKFSF